MKRFYCTICKRVKRTQKWPLLLESMTATYVMDRVGECDYHSNPSLLTRYIPKGNRILSTKSIPVVSQKKRKVS